MATKNNLDVGGEAPVHKDLGNRYRIEGTVYDLGQIVAAVKGEQSDEDWNKRTLTDRLDTVKAYVKDMNAEKVDDAENTAGDGTVKDGTGQIIGGGAESNEEAAKALEQLHAAAGAVGPVDTLRAFNQDDEAKEVEDLIASNERLTDQIAAIRDRLKLTDGDNTTISEALDALQEKASEAEQRATVAEQDASKLRTQLKTAQERATRGPALHGHVDDLKAPY